MSNQKYFGITIGPIYETLALAQKTREIWGASYLFAYICKKIVKEIQNSSKYEILLPNPDYINLSTPGVGLYPDRILLKNKSGSLDELVCLINKIKESIAQELENEFTKKQFSFKQYSGAVNMLTKSSNLKQFFYNYFKVYTIESDASLLDFEKDNKIIGIIKSLNLYLDYAELKPTYAHLDPNPIFILFNFINHSFLVKDAFHQKFNKKGFPAISEIATNELRFISDDIKIEYDKIISQSFKALRESETSNVNQDIDNKENEDIDDQDTLAQIFNINEIRTNLKTYHQYIAIIHADGDRMGSLIGCLEDKQVNEFSKDLIEFAKEANDYLAGERFTKGTENWGYGAAPIYIGGDDLVFFAPVASINQEGEFKTIFDAIQDLDDIFNKYFNQKMDGNYIKYNSLDEVNRPCLSYGVSITYFKYPLKEAYELSRNLMYAVKNDDYPTRNRIHFTLRKHSKQDYTGIIDKNNDTAFNLYLKLLSDNIQKPENDDSEKFVNSINRVIIDFPGAFLDSNINDLTSLFAKQFNEPVHKKYVDYLKAVRIWITNTLNGLTNDERMEMLSTIVAQLKFIHFIRDNEFRHIR